MNPALLPILIALLSTTPLSLQADTKPISSITVIGAVFCDACSINRFSNHSYFLPGARVHVECKFRANSTSTEDITISADRTTDGRGIYTVDVPAVEGFDCREGREIESFCRANLIGSSSTSTQCNVPGLSSSTEHVAVKCGPGSNVCAFILNALNYRPPKRDDAMCGGITKNKVEVQQLSSSRTSNMNSSLFFWPPFGFPHWPFPFPNPPSLPFPFPSIPFFTPPAFQLPPLPFFTPPPAFQFPPIPFFTPSPPPPAFSLPLPPLPPLPQFPPIPPIGTLPPVFVPSPPPPSPPPPAFLFPFPPFPPLFPAPGQPSPPGPPPPAFSLRDPRTWFPFYPPSEEQKDQKP